MTVKRVTWLLAVAAAAAASCSSQGSKAEPVDAAYLMDISADDKEEIASLRAAEAELEDQMAFAEHQIEKIKADKKVAGEELEIAKKEVDAAEAAVEAARTTEEADAARQRVEDSRAHVAWAEKQVEYQEARVDWAEEKHDLAEEKVDLAKARVEQRKAQAVADLPADKRPADVDLTAYNNKLADAELAVRQAEIEVEAAAEKAKAHLTTMDKLAERVPQDRRATWRTTVTEREGEP
jgi:hypothetical protein